MGDMKGEVKVGGDISFSLFNRVSCLGSYKVSFSGAKRHPWNL